MASPDPAHRDRDAAGRARNARPRDATGRPLSRGSIGAERVPDGLALPPDEAVRYAQRLLDDGLPFAAHEVLEAVWKSAPHAERGLWRALAQLAVGLTHLQRGNARGTVALLRRAVDGLRTFAGPPPAGVHVSGLVRYADDLAERVAADGLVAAPPPRLRGPGG